MLSAVVRFLIGKGVLLDAPWYRRAVVGAVYESWDHRNGVGMIRFPGNATREAVDKFSRWWPETAKYVQIPLETTQ
jgi:hypothetical protein